MAAVTLYNIAKVWGQQCDPVTRPGVTLYTATGWIDGKTGYYYGPGNWCVSYDKSSTTVPPDIGNIVGEPTNTPGPSSAVADKACGSCRRQSVTTNVPLPITGASPSTPGAPRVAPKPGIPWWVWVLASLALAQVIYGRNS